MTRGPTISDPELAPDPTRPADAVDHPHGEQVQPHWRRLLGDRALVAVGALALLSALAVIAVDAAHNQGRFVPPLDDVYIHLQYARQIGLGEFLRYQAGAPRTTGASSLLYVLLLGAASVVVPTGLLLYAAVAFGVLCFVATVVLVALLGRELGSRRTGTVAAALTALCGPLLWGVTSGMEVALVAVLAAGLLLAFVREQRSGAFVATPLVAVPLAITRPEGLVLVVAVLAGAVVTLVRSRHRPGVGKALLLALPLLAALAQFGLYRLVTGAAENSGVVAKSWLSRPLGSPLEVADRVVSTARTALELIGGLTTTEVAGPGVAVLAAIGLAAVASRRRVLAAVLALGLAGVLLAVATLQTALWHDGRYLQPFLPIVVLLAVLGIRAIGHAASDARSGRVLTTGLVAVLGAFALVSAPTWALRQGEQAAGIRESAVSVAQWIRGNTPPDAVVAVNDVGAVAWFSDRRVVDLVGLTTPGFARPALEGSGAMYEQLAHLPPAQRPSYFSIFDDTQLVPVGELGRARILGDEPLTSFDLKSPQRDGGPFGGICQTAGGCPVISVWRADWSHVGSGDLPDFPVTGRIVDRVNVGDLTDEAAHGYGVDRALVGVADQTDVRNQDVAGRVVVDSGRHVVGGEHFTLRGLTPGRPVTLVARVDAREPVKDRNTGAGVVAVAADGRGVGDWAFATEVPGLPAGSEHAWAQSTFTIPASAVTAPELTVSLGPRQPFLAPYPDYRSFSYWGVQ
ncbi:hypothetical protein [Actinomycetospora sp. NBRC 106378]|uniref:hypothetical protein n=1 Tax=Actinomycetospora sp. NBRC 106378 TaxID=3032208 RepID=UPI0024A5EC1C|nr:hypothetical protein [Actinomycetospora sp. NBRC 106378]GLZ52755.1 hypothetical protein Acsp07_23720 [Actinomycetospora sp. NBRC 106378]